MVLAAAQERDLAGAAPFEPLLDASERLDRAISPYAFQIEQMNPLVAGTLQTQLEAIGPVEIKVRTHRQPSVSPLLLCCQDVVHRPVFMLAYKE